MSEKTQSGKSRSGQTLPPASQLPTAAAHLRWRVVASFLGLVLLALTPLPADWLVTVDGARIETDGAWEVRGRRIIYTTPDGTLASIRTSEVDLDTSDRVTDEAKQPPAEPEPVAEPEEKREAVLVLTDQDVAQAARSEEAPEEEQQEVQQSGDNEAVEVVSWQHTFNPEENRLEVTGSVRNRGQAMLTRFFLRAMAYNESGNLVGASEAFFEEDVLRPGASTSFTAYFPALTVFDTIRFTASSRGFVANRSRGESEEAAPPP